MKTNILGQRIRQLREEKELNQIELAKLLNISNTTLSQYEAGNRVPSDEIKLVIADLFGVSIDYLLGRDNLTTNRLSESHTSYHAVKDTTSMEQFAGRSNREIDEQLEEVLNKLSSDGSSLMFKGQPMSDTTKEALLMSLKSTLALADKMAEMDKKSKSTK